MSLGCFSVLNTCKFCKLSWRSQCLFVSTVVQMKCWLPRIVKVSITWSTQHTGLLPSQLESSSSRSMSCRTISLVTGRKRMFVYVFVCNTCCLIIKTIFFIDCSANGNQRKKVHPKGEADKARTPTSSRPLSSFSWRVRYSSCCLVVW